LHEQNSRAGLANRLLSRRAKTVATSFQETSGLAPRAKQIVTGLPLRPDLVPQDPAGARKKLQLDPNALTILLFGGSQGARALNRLWMETLKAIPQAKSWQFIHLTGANDFESVESFYQTAGLKSFVKPFWNDMSAVYSAADFAIGRSGANTVMELTRMGKKALLVPFPFATDNHQEFNARWLEKTGAAQVVLEKDLSAEKLKGVLESLPEKDVLRRENAARLDAVPADFLQAARRLADAVEAAR
jgi:UDP-N-acetylglucosamine--N-acetylmuramyl-(pentapeptide) pyrophosphoryl-undecaprenol N-acetylglucosamine transferase